MSQEYEAIIGMEVHAQLLTRSKMFCRCAVVEDVGDLPPNTYVCPVCTGMPGTLPVINQRAVEYTIMTGLALNCQIAEASVFARKNYFYPDLPKGYQISQYELPLASNGWLEIETEAGRRRIGIRRVHLEEDTGKLYHVGDHSLVDFNRAGVPLIEIVTEPDFRSADEAYAYLVKLRTILRYLEVSSGDMEKGAMRCEANISLRPVGSDQLGVKTEIKNLNSFRAVRLALAYEIQRQREILEAGGEVLQQTMGWDEQRGITVPQRSKEYAHDYRYFPEPDLPPLEVSRTWVEEIRARLPELPDARKERFIQEYGLPAYDAGVLVADRAVADYFEAAVQVGDGRVAPKTISNWITGELFRLLNEAGQEIAQAQVTPEALVTIIRLVQERTININTGKEVLAKVFATGRSPRAIVEEEGLAQISDAEALVGIVEQVIAENPGPVAQYRGGKKTVLGWFVGQVMKATRGKANPQLVKTLLQERLEQEEG